MSDHKDIVYIGPSVVYEAGEEPFERQAAIQTLLHALQEVRMGRIDSVAFIGSSECGQRTIVQTLGVRDDMVPIMIGLANIMQADLRDAYEAASIDSQHDSGDPESA